MSIVCGAGDSFSLGRSSRDPHTAYATQANNQVMMNNLLSKMKKAGKAMVDSGAKTMLKVRMRTKRQVLKMTVFVCLCFVASELSSTMRAFEGSKTMSRKATHGRQAALRWLVCRHEFLRYRNSLT
mmetsp:Transcript_50860/g.76043  ORF Transcript_50860/g.76043 Transcript_50860/m.76043 type:complete len:126 (-) Transcript_50860:512-889(-)